MADKAKALVLQEQIDAALGLAESFMQHWETDSGMNAGEIKEAEKARDNLDAVQPLLAASGRLRDSLKEMFETYGSLHDHLSDLMEGGHITTTDDSDRHLLADQLEAACEVSLRAERLLQKLDVLPIEFDADAVRAIMNRSGDEEEEKSC